MAAKEITLNELRSLVRQIIKEDNLPFGENTPQKLEIIVDMAKEIIGTEMEWYDKAKNIEDKMANRCIDKIKEAVQMGKIDKSTGVEMLVYLDQFCFAAWGNLQYPEGCQSQEETESFWEKQI